MRKRVEESSENGPFWELEAENSQQAASEGGSLSSKALRTKHGKTLGRVEQAMKFTLVVDSSVRLRSTFTLC